MLYLLRCLCQYLHLFARSQATLAVHKNIFHVLYQNGAHKPVLCNQCCEYIENIHAHLKKKHAMKDVEPEEKQKVICGRIKESDRTLLLMDVKCIADLSLEVSLKK